MRSESREGIIMKTISLALIVRTLAAWLVMLVIVFPLIWLFMTAFKTELQAIAVPPLIVFTPTLEKIGRAHV